MRSLIFPLSLVCAASPAFAVDWEDLAKDGFGVLEMTSVQGEFNGCDFGRRIPLDNGLIFVCSEYNYNYSYAPDVFILKNVRDGRLKVVIDDDEYDGTVYRR